MATAGRREPSGLSHLAVSGYRSLQNLTLPLAGLTLVCGANGSGKSNLYRSLALIAAAARGDLVAALAAEGGRLRDPAPGARTGRHNPARPDGAGAGRLALAPPLFCSWALGCSSGICKATCRRCGIC